MQDIDFLPRPLRQGSCLGGCNALGVYYLVHPVSRYVRLPGEAFVHLCMVSLLRWCCVCLCLREFQTLGFF